MVCQRNALNGKPSVGVVVLNTSDVQESDLEGLMGVLEGHVGGILEAEDADGSHGENARRRLSERKLTRNNYSGNQYYRKYVPHCRKYDSKGKCRACKPHYKLISWKCFRRVHNCRKYKSNGKCRKCKDNYKLISGKCFKKIPNCKRYNSNGTCRKCKHPYTQISGKCFKKIPNCKRYNSCLLYTSDAADE